MSVEHNNQFKFSPDSPISSKDEDELERKDFAISLANSIRGWKNEESLVIGLFGSWGSGKTSIKNMILESLQEDKENCPQIVPFNPWQWSGENQLSKGFFREIGVALGKTNSGEEIHKRAAKWKEYAATWRVGSFTTGGAYKIVTFLSLVATVFLGSTFWEGYVSEEVFFTIRNVAGFIFILGLLYGGLGTFSEKMATMFEARANTKMQSLPELKEELENLFLKLNNPLLVVIDDVDRLTSEEIRHLFQLIKANADFPNLIFFILCQRDIVERSLEGFAPEMGREFLKKIIQVQFSIPQILREQLDKFILRGLGNLGREGRVSLNYLNDSRWQEVFQFGMKPYFQTLRDVNWFMNSLSFHFSQYLQLDTLEVNAVDLIALETLRVFEDAVYRKLYRSKVLLTTPYSGDFEKEQNELLIRDILESAKNKRQVLMLLESIFPLCKWESDTLFSAGGNPEKILKDLGVGHEKNFDRYFTFSIPGDEISQSDLEQIINHTRNKDLFLKDLRVHRERGLLNELLERLKVNLEGINQDEFLIIISTIFDIGDEFTEEEGYPSPEYFHGLGSDIVSTLLEKKSEVNSRYQLLKDSIENSTAMFMPSENVYRNILSYEKSKTFSEFPCNFEEKIQELKGICLRRIREASKDGRLRKHPYRKLIFELWADWATLEEVKAWIGEELQEKEGLLYFASAFKRNVNPSGESHEIIMGKDLKNFFPIEEFGQRLENLSKGNLTEWERNIISMFINANG